MSCLEPWLSCWAVREASRDITVRLLTEWIPAYVEFFIKVIVFRTWW